MPVPAPLSPSSPPGDDRCEPSAELVAGIAADLRRAPSAPVWRRLGERVRASAAASRGFLTVRRETYRLEVPADGVARQLLRDSEAVRVELVRLAAGATLPWGGQAQELLLLDGLLTDAAGHRWARHEHGLRTGANPALQAGPGGARLYLRTLLDARALAPLEAAWWAGSDERHASDWWPLSPGVDVKRLRGREDVLSMLVRLQPGAVLGDHGHGLDEDCLLLDGELFLGDILLRTDDYHLAPAGARHVDGLSEAGGLLFVHGCLPGEDAFA